MGYVPAIVYHCPHCGRMFTQSEALSSYGKLTNTVLCPGCGMGIFVDDLFSIYCEDFYVSD